MADAERTLRNLLDKISFEQKCENYNVTPISCGGSNVTSHLFTATINNRNGPDLNLFAKVAAMGENIRSQVDCKIYSSEQLFYSKIAKVYQQIQEEHNVPEEHRFQIPKLYGCNPTVLQETIVLENLTMQGFRTHDRLQSVEWEYAAAAVGELAKLHALSIAYQHERPEEFETLLDDFEGKWSVGNSHLEVFLYGGLQLSKVALKDENKNKFIKFFDSFNRKAINNFFKPHRRVVITHGDFKTCNIMYRLDEDGKIQMIPVDYQLPKGGCPVTDLLHFIFTSTDEQFRAQHYQRLLNHYHAQLNLALRRLHLDPDEKYSREDFEYELKEILPFGLVMAVIALPFATVEADSVPKPSRDMVLTDLCIQKSNEVFAERINGVVNDFVKWGVLI